MKGEPYKGNANRENTLVPNKCKFTRKFEIDSWSFLVLPTSCSFFLFLILWEKMFLFLLSVKQSIRYKFTLFKRSTCRKTNPLQRRYYQSIHGTEKYELQTKLCVEIKLRQIHETNISTNYVYFIWKASQTYMYIRKHFLMSVPMNLNLTKALDLKFSEWLPKLNFSKPF